MKKVSKPILLASSSPRRKQLLKQLGLKFRVVKPLYEEDMTLPFSPPALARYLSEQKALSVASLYPRHIIISADSFVVVNNELLGKPKSGSDAIRMLKKTRGKKILVVTGFTILDTETQMKVSRAVKTWLKMKSLTLKEIKKYVKSGEPLDKAGAFAVQGIGSAIVEEIYGDYYNIMGLPVCRVVEALKSFGVFVL